MGANEPGQSPPPPGPLTTLRSRDLPVPSSALAVGAHPDDVEFGAGATLAKWAASGCVVHVLVCTDGSKGTWDVDADPAVLAARRQHEQHEAVLLLAGPAATGRVLGQVDGERDSTLELRGEVARVVREVRPEVVLGHDPWKRYRLHPDHRHAGLLVCDAIVAARDPHFFREHRLPHHRPRALLLFEADEPDHLEDVTGFEEPKVLALEAHESQFESTMHATDEAQLDQFRARVRERLAAWGRLHGAGAAESFRLIDDL